AFLVPYLFVLNPQMLMIDATLGGVIFLLIKSLLGMVGIGAGMIGYFVTNTRWYERLLLLGGGLGLLSPILLSDVVGMSVIVAVFVLQFIRVKKAKASPAIV
ncbi:MAG: DUF3394 domain-containing protein, partial [Oscillospiraceae bacterium]